MGREKKLTLSKLHQNSPVPGTRPFVVVYKEGEWLHAWWCQSGSYLAYITVINKWTMLEITWCPGYSWSLALPRIYTPLFSDYYQSSYIQSQELTNLPCIVWLSVCGSRVVTIFWLSPNRKIKNKNSPPKCIVMPMTKCWLIIPVKRIWTIDRATASSRFLCFFLIFERRSCCLRARELSQVSPRVMDGRYSKLMNSESRDTFNEFQRTIFIKWHCPIRAPTRPNGNQRKR